MKRSEWPQMAGLVAVLVGIALAGRLLPHPPNFTPVAGTALFAGYLFARRSVPLLMTLAIMGLSDIFIGVYEPGVMFTVYSAMLVPVAAGRIARRGSMPLRVATGCITSSMAFFLSTNMAVWRFSGFYEASAAGLWQCFLNALPFLRYTMAGDIVWTSILFGTYGVATYGLPRFRRRSLAYCSVRREPTTSSPQTNEL